MKITGPCGTPETIEHPERHDGGMWPFVMIHGDQATWADSRTELVGALIEGYEELGDNPAGYEAAFEARYTQAVALATSVQTSVLLDAAEAGTFDPADLVATPAGEEQLQAFFVERTVPFDPRGTALAGNVDDSGAPVWDHEVPLVLIATDYAPFTDRPLPTGRVVMIDPSNEKTYLDCLHALSRIVLFVHTELQVSAPT